MSFGDQITFFRNSSTSPGTGYTASGSAAVVAGDICVVLYGGRGNFTTLTVVDSAANSFTANALNTGLNTGGIQPFWFRYTGGATITSVTAAHASNTNDSGLVASFHTGPYLASPLDKNPASGTGATTPYTCPSTGTLTQADETVFGFLGQANAGTQVGYAATSPDLLAAAAGAATGANSGAVAMSYRTVAATTAVAPVMTSSTSTNAALGTASFMKDTGGAPAFNVKPTFFQVFRDMLLVPKREPLWTPKLVGWRMPLAA